MTTDDLGKKTFLFRLSRADGWNTTKYGKFVIAISAVSGDNVGLYV